LPREDGGVNNVLVNCWASPPGGCSAEQTVIWASSPADGQTGVRTTSLTSAYECLPVPIRDPFQFYVSLRVVVDLLYIAVCGFCRNSTAPCGFRDYLLLVPYQGNFFQQKVSYGLTRFQELGDLGVRLAAQCPQLKTCEHFFTFHTRREVPDILEDSQITYYFAQTGHDDCQRFCLCLK
jgi:hypothetical protein